MLRLSTVVSFHIKSNTYWFPAKRDASRSNKHSIEVVVKDKDSPVDEHDEVNAASCCV